MKRFIRFLKPTVPRVCWLFIEAIIVMIVTQAWPYLCRDRLGTPFPPLEGLRSAHTSGQAPAGGSSEQDG
jgi:hypothetical protein